MKPLFHTPLAGLLLVTSSWSVAAATGPHDLLATVGPLPSQRSGQTISPQELNPFSTRSKTVAAAAKGPEEETQESKIRKILGALGVSGVRLDGAGRRMALVGDIILREGTRVVPVLPEQTETLVVSKIAPDKVELVFVETKEATLPRTITLRVNRQAQVAQLLSGQARAGREMYVATATRAAQAGQAAAQAAAGVAAAAAVEPVAPEAWADSPPPAMPVAVVPGPLPPVVETLERPAPAGGSPATEGITEPVAPPPSRPHRFGGEPPESAPSPSPDPEVR